MIPQSIEILQEIERNFPVEKWKINGLHIWPLIRIDLGFVIYYQRLGENIQRDNSSSNIILKRAIETLNGSFKVLKNIILDPKTKVGYKESDIIFLSDGVSYTSLNEEWYEKFCDPIKTQFEKRNKKTFLLEQRYNCFAPRFSEVKNIQSFIDLILFKSIVLKKQMIKDLENFDEFVNYIENLSKKHGFSISFLKNLEKRILKIESLITFFEATLKKIKPSLGFVVCYYSDTTMAFIAACKLLNIKVVDIQHGVQTGDHPAYSFWGKIPQEGFDLLPNYFWCWGKTEFSEFVKWKTPNHLPLKGGNPFLNIWLNQDSEIGKVYDRKLEFIEKDNKPIILLTLQFSIEQINLIKHIIDVIRQTQEEFNWWIRLHPSLISQQKDFEAYFFSNKINIYQLGIPSKLPLYSLLRKANAHITHSSSTVIEAANFGIKSIITSPLGVELFQNIIQQKMAVGVYEKENIIVEIKNIINQLRQPTKDLFFTSEETNLTINDLLILK